MVAEKLARSDIDQYTCNFYIKKLQTLLPKDEKAHIYSPIIWVLTHSDDSYPAWYAAGIVASNIEEITGLSSMDLCNIIRNNLIRDRYFLKSKIYRISRFNVNNLRNLQNINIKVVPSI